MKTFVKLIEKEVTKLYPSASVSVKRVKKTNDTTLYGLTIHASDATTSPLIYLESYYDSYMCGNELEDIVAEICSVYESKKEFEFDFDSLGFDQLKDKIFLKVVNSQNNASYLQNLVHREFLDLSIIPYIEVLNNGYIMIEHKLLKHLGKTENEIFECALSNIKSDCYLDCMSDVLNAIMDDPHMVFPESPLFVASNKKKVFGASVMLSEKFLSDCAERFDSDFFIIPSSIHELIFVSVDLVTDPKEIEEMIHEVNTTQVQEDEILSYTVYRYNRKESCLAIA